MRCWNGFIFYIRTLGPFSVSAEGRNSEVSRTKAAPATQLLQITDNLDLLLFAHWLSITCAVSCKCNIPRRTIRDPPKQLASPGSPLGNARLGTTEVEYLPYRCYLPVLCTLDCQRVKEIPIKALPLSRT